MKTPQPKDVFRVDIAQHADLALVIGAADSELLKHRVSAGIALIKAKNTAKLMLCGDGRDKDPQGRSEAERMKQSALGAGVLESQIILEDESRDVIELAKSLGRRWKSDELLKTVKSLFLVSSAWHLLRVHMIMKRHLPHQIALFCHPTPEGHTASNWQTTPQGRATVENELRLVEKLLKTGY